MVKKSNQVIYYTIPHIEAHFHRPKYPFGRCINFGPGLREENEASEYLSLWFSNLTSSSSIQVLFKGQMPVGNGMKGKQHLQVTR